MILIEKGRKLLLRRGREYTLVEYLETIRRYDRGRDRREYKGRKKSKVLPKVLR